MFKVGMSGELHFVTGNICGLQILFQAVIMEAHSISSFISISSIHSFILILLCYQEDTE